MNGWWLVVVAGLLLGPAQDLESLVDQLGSTRYSDREAAARELEQLGSEALPPLRAAARESRDAEIRLRAEALAMRIEQTVLIEPTRLKLDFQNRPLNEVVQAIQERTQIELALMPPNPEFWRDRKVTLVAEEPVTFWEAIDRLSAAGQLQLQSYPGSMSMGGGGLNRQRGMLRLDATGNNALAVPTANDGPFRWNLISISHHRDLNFQHGSMAVGGRVLPGGRVFEKAVRGVRIEADGLGNPVRNRDRDPRVSEQCYISIQLTGEPRLMLTQGGGLELIEAIDDEGQSLLADEGEGDALRTAGYYGMNPGMTTIQLQAYLQLPEEPGKRIRVLRGRLPVVVSSLRPDPVRVAWSDAERKVIQGSEEILTIESVQFDRDAQQRTVALTVRPRSGQAASIDPFGNPMGGTLIHQIVQGLPARIEAVDEQGRSYQVAMSRSQVQEAEAQVTLMLLPMSDVGPPVELRFYELSRAETEARFEFRDFPLP